MTAVLVARTYAEGRAVAERYPQLGPVDVVSLRGWLRTFERLLDTVDRVYVAVDADRCHSGDRLLLPKVVRMLRFYMRKNGSNGPVLEIDPKRWER